MSNITLTFTNLDAATAGAILAAAGGPGAPIPTTGQQQRPPAPAPGPAQGGAPTGPSAGGPANQGPVASTMTHSNPPPLPPHPPQNQQGGQDANALRTEVQKAMGAYAAKYKAAGVKQVFAHFQVEPSLAKVPDNLLPQLLEAFQRG